MLDVATKPSNDPLDTSSALNNTLSKPTERQTSPVLSEYAVEAPREGRVCGSASSLVCAAKSPGPLSPLSARSNSESQNAICDRHSEHGQAKTSAVVKVIDREKRPLQQTAFDPSPHVALQDYSYPTAIARKYHESPGEDLNPEEHPLRILIYLSLLSPIFSLLITIYTFLTLISLLLFFPFCFYIAHLPLCSAVHHFLYPALHLQLRLAYSSTEPNTDHSNVSMLILVHLLSPVYAVGIALSAWVAAAFWFYAAILGDPDGKDGRDDGRAAVLGVRRWWERWLERAL